MYYGAHQCSLWLLLRKLARMTNTYSLLNIASFGYAVLLWRLINSCDALAKKEKNKAGIVLSPALFLALLILRITRTV